MKRITLLIGILVVLVVFFVPPLPAEQEGQSAEPNRPGPEKTDVRVLVKQLENEIDLLQKQIRILQADNVKNKSAVVGYDAKFVRIDSKLGDLENHIRSCCASKQSSAPKRQQQNVVPKK